MMSKQCTIFFEEQDWTEHFHLPLSIEAFGQFNQIEELAHLYLHRKDSRNIIGAVGKPTDDAINLG